MNHYQIKWKRSEDAEWRIPFISDAIDAEENLLRWAGPYLEGTVNFMQLWIDDALVWEGKRVNGNFDLSNLTFEPPKPPPMIRKKSVLEI